MRKITTIILIFVFAMLLSKAVFAAEIKIESAEQLSSGKVKVVCALTGGESTQVITVMAYEKDASGEELSSSYYEKLIHIDQFEADVTDGKLEFDKPKQNIYCQGRRSGHYNSRHYDNNKQ